MVNLKVTGWGPFPVPGEKARLRRLERSVDQLMATSSSDSAEYELSETRAPRIPGDSVAAPVSSRGNDDEVEPSSRGWENLGERKIFFEDQEGVDVAQLQQRLAGFGFLQESSISGKFDNETKDALTAFQHKFGIYVDGVAGSVTMKVLRFLSSIDYQPDTIPVSDDVLVLIQRIARSRSLGIALIGRSFVIQRSGSGNMDARLKIVNRASRELVKALNKHPVLQGAEFPERYSPDRAIHLANSIDAELVIYLDVLDNSEIPPGIATFFFHTGEYDSAIGTPLAECIHDELIRVPGVRDRGCIGEDSFLLQGPKAPTVRIELGNLRDPGDQERLKDGSHIKQLVAAITTGISRLYDLDLPEPKIVTHD